MSKNISRAANFILTVTFFFYLDVCAPALFAESEEERKPQGCLKPDFMKGITFAGWRRGSYLGPDSTESMAKLRSTGAEWISIIAFNFERSKDDPRILSEISNPQDDLGRRLSGKAHSRVEVAQAIRLAHKLGLRVMLKLHVILEESTNQWHGQIGENFSQEHWNVWFKDYGELAQAYALLAEENGVEIFCIGNELESTTHRASDWRRLIDQSVRPFYSGVITYAATPEEAFRIKWWDALDRIGVNAYYALSNELDFRITAADLVSDWKPHLIRLVTLRRRVGKPLILTEIGYRSAKGATVRPWDWMTTKHAPIDLKEQADAYLAALYSLGSQEWLSGIFWWTWTTAPDNGGAANNGFTPQNKPAEDILRQAYGDNNCGLNS